MDFENSSSASVTPPRPVKTNYKRLGLILAVLILVAGIGTLGYLYWNEKNRADDLSTQLNQLASSQPEVTLVGPGEGEENDEAVISEDDTVIEALKAYCERTALPEGHTRLFKAGTTGPNSETIIYSKDKTFAKLNVVCGSLVTGETHEGGGAAAYFMKKVNNTWVYILSTQQQLPQEDIEMYGIPEDFTE